MPSSHRDAHPYGRSGTDVRRRTERSTRIRRVRITQLVLFSLMAIAMLAAVFWAITQLRSPQTEEAPPPETVTGEDGVICPDEDATPPDPEEVTVSVQNGTSRSGLAGSVGDDLTERGYEVDDPKNTSEAEGAVTVVYGPSGYLAAQSVAAQFDDVSFRVDDRDSDTVDVLLGDEYESLSSGKKADERLADPVDPPEGCPGS